MSSHKHTDACTEMGLHRSAYSASRGEPIPRRTFDGLSSKPWRQMRRDLGGAFGNHNNEQSKADMEKNQ